MIVSREEFFKAQQRLENIPFNQTEEWFEKCGFKNDNACFFIDDLSNPHIGCWGIIYRRSFIGEQLLISGESYKHIISAHHLRDFYSKLISHGFAIIEITSLQFYDIKFEIGIRRAGFLRPMIAKLSPLTILLEPTNKRKPNKTWNKNIRLAKEADLKFDFIEFPTMENLQMFCKLFDELKLNKNLNYALTADSLHELFKKGNYKLFFVYDSTMIPVAGRIVYCNGNAAYDVHAANSALSRKYGAAYFIIDRIVDYLAQHKITIFDYGMISPSSNEMDDIYRSKSNSGGTPVQYNGQWVYYKSKYVEYMVNGFLYLYKKVPRF